VLCTRYDSSDIDLSYFWSDATFVLVTLLLISRSPFFLIGTRSNAQVRYHFMGSKLYYADLEKRRVGFRVTVQGTFKFMQNLRAFPFDRQGLKLVMQLGLEINSRVGLFEV